MAFLAEQANGKASDGFQRIMEIEPSELHERVPFICGSSNTVLYQELLEACLSDQLDNNILSRVCFAAVTRYHLALYIRFFSTFALLFVMTKSNDVCTQLCESSLTYKPVYSVIHVIIYIIYV